MFYFLQQMRVQRHTINALLQLRKEEKKRLICLCCLFLFCIILILYERKRQPDRTQRLQEQRVN